MQYSTVYSDESFLFESQKEFHTLPFRHILYFGSANRRVELHTKQGVFSFYGRLARVEAQAVEHGFIRIHKSYLVNAAYVASVEYASVTLAGGATLPISRPYRKQVRALLRQGVEQ